MSHNAMKDQNIKSNNSNNGMRNKTEVDWRNNNKSAKTYDRPAVFMEYSNQFDHYFNNIIR